MLNLVQLQERLKDMPMQVIMQYANGMNPQVPPFIALGELNRRKQMQESAAAQQAQQMEGAPTVKDQIEQQTGLMALQAQKQKQAMQQMAQQAVQPQPVQMARGGIAQGGLRNPEMLKKMLLRALQAQKQAVQPQPVQMARGGIAQGRPQNPEMLKKMMLMAALKRGGIDRLPMRPDMFKRGDYARGGIVAFQNGGAADVINAALASAGEDDEEEKKLTPAQKLLMEVLQARKARPDVTERRRQAGLPTEAPDTSAATRADLERRQKELESSDTFLSRLMAIQPGRFSSGSIGTSMAKYDAERKAKMDEIRKLKAAAEDQRAAAQVAFKQGRFDESEKEIAAADKFDLDAAKIASDIDSKATTKGTNLKDMAKVEFNALVAKGRDPNDPATLQEAYRNAAAYVTYAGPRVDVQQQGVGIQQMGRNIELEKALDDAEKKIRDSYFTKIIGAIGNPKKIEELNTQMEADIERRKAEIRASVTGQSARPSAPAPKASGAATPTRKPDISTIQGAPAGAVVGNFVAGKGWEIKDKNGKLIGYGG